MVKEGLFGKIGDKLANTLGYARVSTVDDSTPTDVGFKTETSKDFYSQQADHILTRLQALREDLQAYIKQNPGRGISGKLDRQMEFLGLTMDDFMTKTKDEADQEKNRETIREARFALMDIRAAISNGEPIDEVKIEPRTDVKLPTSSLKGTPSFRDGMKDIQPNSTADAVAATDPNNTDFGSFNVVEDQEDDVTVQLEKIEQKMVDVEAEFRHYQHLSNREEIVPESLTKTLTELEIELRQLIKDHPDLTNNTGKGFATGTDLNLDGVQFMLRRLKERNPGNKPSTYQTENLPTPSPKPDTDNASTDRPDEDETDEEKEAAEIANRILSVFNFDDVDELKKFAAENQKDLIEALEKNPTALEQLRQGLPNLEASCQAQLFLLLSYQMAGQLGQQKGADAQKTQSGIAFRKTEVTRLLEPEAAQKWQTASAPALLDAVFKISIAAVTNENNLEIYKESTFDTDAELNTRLDFKASANAVATYIDLFKMAVTEPTDDDENEEAIADTDNSTINDLLNLDVLAEFKQAMDDPQGYAEKIQALRDKVESLEAQEADDSENDSKPGFDLSDPTQNPFAEVLGPDFDVSSPIDNPFADLLDDDENNLDLEDKSQNPFADVLIIDKDTARAVENLKKKEPEEIAEAILDMCIKAAHMEIDIVTTSLSDLDHQIQHPGKDADVSQLAERKTELQNKLKSAMSMLQDFTGADKLEQLIEEVTEQMEGDTEENSPENIVRLINVIKDRLEKLHQVTYAEKRVKYAYGRGVDGWIDKQLDKLDWPVKPEEIAQKIKEDPQFKHEVIRVKEWLTDETADLGAEDNADWRDHTDEALRKFYGKLMRTGRMKEGQTKNRERRNAMLDECEYILQIIQAQTGQEIHFTKHEEEAAHDEHGHGEHGDEHNKDKKPKGRAMQVGAIIGGEILDVLVGVNPDDLDDDDAHHETEHNPATAIGQVLNEIGYPPQVLTRLELTAKRINSGNPTDQEMKMYAEAEAIVDYLTDPDPDEIIKLENEEPHFQILFAEIDAAIEKVLPFHEDKDKVKQILRIQALKRGVAEVIRKQL
jgi:hypothetical protein